MGVNFKFNTGGFAEGSSAATGNYSHAEGMGNETTNEAQHISGKYATIDQTGTSIFKVGIGTSTDARRDALNISTNGEFTFGDAQGNYVVLNTTLLQRLKDLVDVPYSFSYAWDYASQAGGTIYFDIDWRTTNQTIRDFNNSEDSYDAGYLVSPTGYTIIHNEYSSEEPGGQLTFSEPITTFPTLFYHYNGYGMYGGSKLPVVEIIIPDKVNYIPDRCFCKSGLDIFFENSKSIKEIGISAFYESWLRDSVLDLSNVSLFGPYALSGCGPNVNKVCIDSRKATFRSWNVFFIQNNSAELVDLNPDANVILDTNSGNVEIINVMGDTVYSGTFREEGGTECVAPGTKILVDSIGNTKNVEDLQVGDIVLTQDGDQYIEAILDKVITKDHYHYSILTLEDDSTLTISRDHAVLTTDGWKAINPILTEQPKEAKWLTDKDTVITRTGPSKIKNIEHKHLLKNPMIMYNLGVSGYYNYFANNVCVYECSGSE